MWRILSISAALCIVVVTAKFPSYLSPCPWDAPIEKISECARKVGNNALPKIEHGDKKNKFPSINPLVVPRMKIVQGNKHHGVSILWSPAELWGLHQANITDMVVDVNKRHVSINYTLPQFVISGHYKARGRELPLHVIGEGDSNITMTNLKIHHQFEWQPKKGSDGKDYADIRNASFTLRDVGSMSMKFEGLFTADRQLSESIISFLNENWKAVLKEVGPSVTEAVGEVLYLVVRKLMQVAPLNELFTNSPF